MAPVPQLALGDARTPSCTSCHGQSDKHLAGDKDGTGRPAPDFVFKKGVYEKIMPFVQFE